MDKTLEDLLQERLSDIDGHAFLVYRSRENGQATNDLVKKVENTIVEKNLSVSEAKGFLEYMKLVIESHSHVQNPQ